MGTKSNKRWHQLILNITKFIELWGVMLHPTLQQTILGHMFLHCVSTVAWLLTWPMCVLCFQDGKLKFHGFLRLMRWIVRDPSHTVVWRCPMFAGDVWGYTLRQYCSIFMPRVDPRVILCFFFDSGEWMVRIGLVTHFRSYWVFTSEMLLSKFGMVKKG